MLSSDSHSNDTIWITGQIALHNLSGDSLRSPVIAGDKELTLNLKWHIVDLLIGRTSETQDPYRGRGFDGRLGLEWSWRVELAAGQGFCVRLVCLCFCPLARFDATLCVSDHRWR